MDNKNNNNNNNNNKDNNKHINDLESLMERFKEKMNTHPELSTIWYNYLNSQNKKINNLIAQGNSIINNMDKMSDISIQSLALFLLLETNRLF